MLRSLIISDVATYVGEPQRLTDLRQFNYVYGPNGSGKTTISRVLADVAAYDQCELTWENGRALETVVYNRDFVDRVLSEPGDVPGIFTLGEQSAELLEAISKAEKELASLTADRDQLRKTLEGGNGDAGKRGELSALWETFRDAAWAKKDNLGPACRGAFRGFLDSRERFGEGALRKSQANPAPIRTRAYLEERASKVFGDPPTSLPLIPAWRADACSHLDLAVLARPIVGKTNAEISALIEHLGNSDWVQAGCGHLNAAAGKCPFCQQPVPPMLAASLEAYFDKSYREEIDEVGRLHEAYQTALTGLLAAIDGVLANAPAELDVDRLKSARDGVDARGRANLQKIADKLREPSGIVQLEDLAAAIAQASGVIATANERIAEHNGLVQRLAAEKKALTGECWKYLFEVELKAELADYQRKKGALDRAIASLEQQVEAKTTALGAATGALRRLRSKTTSIEPTIDSINRLLISFGFDSFSLAKADTSHCYKLVRADGVDAKSTLSEGERTFIAFLYYYHLLNGSGGGGDAAAPKVAVVDDPVSSLDNDVLFVVSSLVARLREAVRQGSVAVRQLILLTHNVYFHKESTYHGKRPAGQTLHEETFWTIRRCNGKSSIKRHDCNPIRTGYELLWAELHAIPRSGVTVQNAMRRILEHYFKILGDVDPRALCDGLSGAEQVACRSLLSWVNDGSHSAADDLFVSIDDTTLNLFEKVFRQLFDSTGHSGHYEMMMSRRSDGAT